MTLADKMKTIANQRNSQLNNIKSQIINRIEQEAKNGKFVIQLRSDDFYGFQTELEDFLAKEGFILERIGFSDLRIKWQ